MSMEQFEAYLKNEKKMSANTVQAYVRDVRHFDDFVKSRGLMDVSEASNGFSDESKDGRTLQVYRKQKTGFNKNFF